MVYWALHWTHIFEFLSDVISTNYYAFITAPSYINSQFYINIELNKLIVIIIIILIKNNNTNNDNNYINNNNKNNNDNINNNNTLLKKKEYIRWIYIYSA